MLGLFRRFVDPVAYRQEQIDRDRQRDRREEEGDSDKPSPTFACRICDHRSTNPSYCPTCLADTMLKT